MHTWRVFLVYACIAYAGVREASAWKRPGESIRRRQSAPGVHRRRRDGPAADPTTCVPNGLTMFFDELYEVTEPNGMLYGYDASDKRYRDPVNSDHIPGGNATLAYTDPTSSANLWLAGTHITTHDEEYRDCIHVGAVVDLQAPLWYHWDKYPYWEPYPVWGQRADPIADNGTLPQISMPSQNWSTFYHHIEDFIDTHLSNGTNVLMFDAHGDFFDEFIREIEACGAAGYSAIVYIARKMKISAADAVNQLASRRSCMAGILSDPGAMLLITALVEAPIWPFVAPRTQYGGKFSRYKFDWHARRLENESMQEPPDSLDEVYLGPGVSRVDPGISIVPQYVAEDKASEL